MLSSHISRALQHRLYYWRQREWKSFAISFTITSKLSGVEKYHTSSNTCSILTHSLPPSLPHSLPPSLPPSLTPSLTHSLPPSLTPSLPPSLTHVYLVQKLTQTIMLSYCCHWNSESRYTVHHLQMISSVQPSFWKFRLVHGSYVHNGRCFPVPVAVFCHLHRQNLWRWFLLHSETA